MRLLGVVVGGLVWCAVLGAPPAWGQVDGSSGSSMEGGTAEVVLPADALLACARSVLEQRGEAILRQDAQQGRLLTWPRFVGPDELARLAILASPDRAAWVEGMYQLQLTIAPGGAGPARWGIEARLLGRHGESLPLLRPSPWERLVSRGVLEQEVAGALSGCSSSADPAPEAPAGPTAADAQPG